MSAMSRLEMVAWSYAVSLNCAAILLIPCSPLLKSERDCSSFFPARDIPKEAPAPLLALPKGSVPAPRRPRRCYQESCGGEKASG